MCCRLGTDPHKNKGTRMEEECWEGDLRADRPVDNYRNAGKSIQVLGNLGVKHTMQKLKMTTQQEEQKKPPEATRKNISAERHGANMKQTMKQTKARVA